MTTVRVACVQLKAHDIDDAAEALDDALAAIDLAAAEGAQIVVLPEMAYPAYVVGSRLAYRNAAGSEAAVLAAFAGRAKRHAIVLAVGIGITAGDDLFNTAVLFGTEGEELGRYQKSFLWHFDRNWFTAGSAYPAFDTPFGRVGMLICADSRAPEIARALVLDGAELILDPTAWVGSGRSFETLYNPQTDYIMTTRALENGVPIAAANKWGEEAGSVVYAGKSMILDAAGKTIAEGPTDEDSCIVGEVEIGPARPAVERRPDMYADLSRSTETLAITKLTGERISLDAPIPRIAVAQVKRSGSAADFVATARRVAKGLAPQDTGLLLFPDTSAILDDGDLQQLSDLSVDVGRMHLGFTLRGGYGASRTREFVLLSAGATVFRYTQSHLTEADREAGLVAGDAISDVIETPAGRVGVMIGDEALVPEVARCLMLRGADVILWPAAPARRSLLSLARCRADENRVFVALAAHATPGAGCAVIAPTGAVLATAPAELEVAVGALVNPALSRTKELVPGTNVLHSRQPETYARLVEV